MKILIIIVNAGHADEVTEIVRDSGIAGATILNARGEGACHESFMGITLDTEKEMIFCVTTAENAETAILNIKEKAGINTPCHAVCFTMPVERVVGLRTYEEK